MCQGSISPTFLCQSRAELAQITFVSLNVNSIWQNALNHGDQHKICRLKYAVTFQQKCSWNIRASFTPYILCWQIFALLKLVGEIDSWKIIWSVLTSFWDAEWSWETTIRTERCQHAHCLISLTGWVDWAVSIDQTGQGGDGNQSNKGIHGWGFFSVKNI